MATTGCGDGTPNPEDLASESIAAYDGSSDGFTMSVPDDWILLDS